MRFCPNAVRCTAMFLVLFAAVEVLACDYLPNSDCHISSQPDHGQPQDACHIHSCCDAPGATWGLNGATGKQLGTIGEEQYGAESSQSVETCGKRGKRIRVAEFSIGIADADLQRRSTQLAYAIIAAYAEVSAERHKL